MSQAPLLVTPAVHELRPSGEKYLMQQAGDRWGLRYQECDSMEAAYQRRRMDRIEAQLAALGAGGDLPQ